MKTLMYVIDSILMRLWLIWIALTKRYFICCGYNKKILGQKTKGLFAFSHLPKNKELQIYTWNALSKFGEVERNKLK